MSIPPAAVGIDYSGLPERYRAGMRRYLEDGILPGDFLQAVMRNDLLNAINRADDPTALKGIVDWFYNEAPGPCWGSRAKIDLWREQFETGGER